MFALPQEPSPEPFAAKQVRTATSHWRNSAISFVLVCADLTAVWLATQASAALLGLLGLSLQFGLSPYLVLPIFVALGLYPPRGQTPYDRFCLRAAGIVVFVVLSVLAGGIPQTQTVAGNAVFAAVLFLTGFYLETLVRHLLISMAVWRAPTVFVGNTQRARELSDLFAAQPELGFLPVGFVGADGTAPMAAAGKGEPVVVERPPEVAILTAIDQLAEIAQIQERLSGVQIILYTDLHGIRPRRVKSLGHSVGIHLKRTKGIQFRLLKRAIDLAIAVPVLLVAAPLLALSALLIKIVDPGPAMFFQPRIGEGGRVFNVPKLRTMYVDATRMLETHLRNNPQAQEEWRRFYKLRNDPRVLPVIGNMFRRSSIDELPQLWSIIVGDMSLIGPRPFPAYHLDRFDNEFRDLRASVPPGLTGLWQVASRSNGSLSVQKEQDAYYVQNWSLWLDLFIVLQTVPAVVFANGAR